MTKPEPITAEDVRRAARAFVDAVRGPEGKNAEASSALWQSLFLANTPNPNPEAIKIAAEEIKGELGNVSAMYAANCDHMASILTDLAKHLR